MKPTSSWSHTCGSPRRGRRPSRSSPEPRNLLVAAAALRVRLLTTPRRWRRAVFRSRPAMARRPLRWRVFVREYDPPCRFLDVQVRGPLRSAGSTAISSWSRATAHARGGPHGRSRDCPSDALGQLAHARSSVASRALWAYRRGRIGELLCPVFDRSRHDALTLARRAGGSHVDRRRLPPGPASADQALGLRRRADLPQEPAAVGVPATARDDDVRAFAATRRAARGVRRVFAHASYLINLASPDRVAVEARRRRLHRRARACRGAGAVLRGRSIPARTWAPARAEAGRVVAALDEVDASHARLPGASRAREHAGGRPATRSAAACRELGELLRPRPRAPRRRRRLRRHLPSLRRGVRHRSAAGRYGNVVDEECARAHRRLARAGLSPQRRARGRWAPASIATSTSATGSARSRGRSPARSTIPGSPRVPKVLETAKDPEPTADLRNLATLRRLRPGGVRAGSSASDVTPTRRQSVADRAGRAAGRDRRADVLAES